MIQRLVESGEPAEVQETAFSIDVLGRYTCNTWDEATDNGGAPFDVVVIGAGMFGAYAAVKAYREGAARGLRVLVLEAGPFLVSEHVQNLARVGLNVAGPVAHDPGVPRERVWGLPWRSATPFPGLAYAVGGRSLYWGGWAPRMTDEDLALWPKAAADFMRAERAAVEEEIGTASVRDYIHGELQKDLRKKLAAAAPSVPTVGKVEEAPLAVQGDGPASGLFSFDKYSSAPILLDAIREDIHHAKGQDAARRLFLVPRVHVTRLQTDGAFVTGVEAVVNGLRRFLPLASHANVVLANGTIESTRLALESFPTDLMGRNLMGHLRSNLVCRVRRSVFSVQKKPEAAAVLVRGSTPEGRYHIQVTATGSDGTNSEEDMWRMVPDLDVVEQMRHKDPDWVVMTFRGIGEMRGDRGAGKPADRSWMDLSPWERDEFGMRRAWVQIIHTPGEDRIWTAMHEAAIGLARGIAGSDAQHDLEFLVDGKWSPTPPPETKTRDRLGTTHHEAGTLWMGTDPAGSVTDLDGRFHHVANAYVIGPATFPTMGSANPTLTGLVLARRTTRALVRQATPAPLEPGFTPLFDGTTRGWRQAGAGSAHASRGILEVRGGSGVLWYADEPFGDFVLRLEYRQHAEHDNSGVFLRIPPLDADERPASTEGYEVQIDERGVNPDDGTTGHPDRTTGAVYALAPATRRAARPIGTWNDLEIEARGDRITVKLNGEQVSQLAGGRRNARGHIGLQNHHDGCHVQFRNLRVKPL